MPIICAWGILYLNDAEAFFRNAHVLSFDVSTMMSAYAPGNILTSPNGLSGTEACRIFRYAGFSPYMNSVGIYMNTTPI